MKKYSLILCVLLSSISCKKEDTKPDPYLISKQNIGALSHLTQVKDLVHIFSEDSITKYIGGDEFSGGINDYEIFDKSGKLLLALTPREELDSTSTIKSIKVVAPRFKTAKGINSNSIFKEIKDNYTISSIQNTLRNLIVSVDEINAYFTIDKEQLPSNLRFDLNLKINSEDIPDNAKIKNFFVQWY